MAYAWIAGRTDDPALALALFLVLALIPVLIAGIGLLGLHGGTAERVRAWALIIVGLGVALAVLAPYAPDDPGTLMTLQATLLLAYGYVLVDWARQAGRNGLQPFWAHGLIALALLVAAGLAAAIATGA